MTFILFYFFQVTYFKISLSHGADRMLIANVDFVHSCTLAATNTLIALFQRRSNHLHFLLPRGISNCYWNASIPGLTICECWHHKVDRWELNLIDMQKGEFQLSSYGD